MAASVSDFKLAGAAAGFTLGFGFLTVWTAIKQTQSIKSPLRSAYIYMVWGEITANISIGIVGWLFLEGIIPLGVPVLFFLLFFWVFEIQLLMQIIINRIYIVAADQRRVNRMKWIIAGIITAINITVFNIWIPAHLDPPASHTYFVINKYWDRTSKILILVVDAGLNWWFLRIVKERLVRYHGLKKYQPLVAFNARLMVLSILMDVMLIGLMSLKNPLVYIQFHPVTYLVKLNIEMSMASLITKLARGSGSNSDELIYPHSSSYHGEREYVSSHGLDNMSKNGQSERIGNIRKETSIQVTIHDEETGERTPREVRNSNRRSASMFPQRAGDVIQEEDRLPLKSQNAPV